VIARSPAALALCFSLLDVVACDTPAARPPARLWTMDDYVALSRGAGEGNPEAQLPAVMPLGMVLTDDGADRFRLTLGPTMLEDYTAAYVTTEVWQGFDKVWVQPLYVLISGWSADGTPIRFSASDPLSRPIFTVGPESAFYSPYWRTFYVQIAANAPPEKYRSSRDITNDKSLVPTSGPARLASLIRTKGVIKGPVGDRDRYPTLPLPEKVGPVKLGGVGYVDGVEIEYIDLGEGGFQWDRELVVEETPLFVPVMRDDAGGLRPMEVPTVAGTGPLWSGQSARIVQGRPRYGSYWRLYLAVMPPSARVFAPPQFPKLQQALQAAGIPVAAVDASIANLPVDELAKRLVYVSRVALEGAKCFASVAALDSCTWLNSQSAIELHLGAEGMQKTDITVTCPFVSYADIAVPNP
jgi:hypothetical protein